MRPAAELRTPGERLPETLPENFNTLLKPWKNTGFEEGKGAETGRD